MAKLATNVYVDGKWYGPDYPDAGEPPSGSVTNEAAFVAPEAGTPGVDRRFRSDDFAVESGEQPSLRAEGTVTDAATAEEQGDDKPAKRRTTTSRG